MIWLILFTILGLTFLRILRLTGFLQEKEYRLDRLMSFFKTQPGRAELWRLLPTRSDLTRTGLKRPVLTARAGIVWASIWLIFGVLMGLSWWLPTGSLMVGWWVIVYALLPIWAVVAIVPGAILVELITYWYLYQARRLMRLHNPIVIGVTGSYGKTTTKQIMAQILAGDSEVFYTQKSFNTRLSAARDVVRRYDGQKICIIEYAAYTLGEIKGLAEWIQPDWAVVTGFTPQHLALFGSTQKIIQAKAELVKALINKNQVLYNGLDAQTQEIVKIGRAVRPIDYTSPKAVDLTQIKLNDQGQLSFRWRGQDIHTKLIGRHYLDAIKASLIIGQKLGLDESQLAARTGKIEPNSRFIQTRNLANQTLLIDDGYSTNPSGFTAAVNLTKELKAGREAVLITAGIVDLGDMSEQVHSQLASQARAVFDQVLYLSEVGVKEFAAEFKDDLIQDPAQIKSYLEADLNNLIVLKEGRLPIWAEKLLNHE